MKLHGQDRGHLVFNEWPSEFSELPDNGLLREFSGISQAVELRSGFWWHFENSVVSMFGRR